MFKNLHPKCANPACVTTFDWLVGGKLFRFRRENKHAPVVDGSTSDFDNSHHVAHFWLCERCAHIFTLSYEPGKGVLIRLLWPELPAPEKKLELPVS
jgi:hypothetical protein